MNSHKRFNNLAGANASMHRLWATVVAGLVACAVGCRSAAPNATIFHAWGREDAADFKAYLDSYTNVLVASIYESHWEDRGPDRKTPYHYKGKVVRSYKGDWKVSEEIAFVHYVDAPAPTNTPSPPHGELLYVFTNAHTNAEIGVDTGDWGVYDAESKPALDYIFPQGSRR